MERYLKSKFKRHDLVYFDNSIRATLPVHLIGTEAFWPEDEVRHLVSGGYGDVFVPGIVRRQEVSAETLGIGLSSPYRRDGMRLRASTSIPVSAIQFIQSPYQVASLVSLSLCKSFSLPIFHSLSSVLEAAKISGVTCGIFGSVALEVVTGLSYCHEASDLDVIVRYESFSAVKSFYKMLCSMEKETDINIDGELELCDGSAAKLKEFFSDSATVLTKGFEEVRLLDKEEAVSMNHT